MTFQANDGEDVSEVFTAAEDDRAVDADDVLARDLSPVIPNIPTQVCPPGVTSIFCLGGGPLRTEVSVPNMSIDF